MVPGPATRTGNPERIVAAVTARYAFAPGSTIAPASSDTESGSS